MTIRRSGALFLSIFILMAAVPFYAEAPKSIDFSADIEAIKNTRKGMQDILQYVKGQPDLHPAQKIRKKRFTSRAQRKLIWQTWQLFLDRTLILDDLGKRYDALYNQLDNRQKKRQAFRVGYAAFLAQYRYALEFISLMENDPGMHTMLNEEVPEFALQSDLYKKLKFRFLNILRGAEFARLDVLYNYYGEDKQLLLSQGIQQDSQALWQHGKSNGPKLTVKNAVKIVQGVGFTAWFPLQKNVSEWMGNVKVLRSERSLINAAQVAEMQSLLQPGDILLERREWYLSNIGLPGYWPHAALYIGTEEQRSKYFSTTEVARKYANNDGSLNKYLKFRYPDAYQISLNPQEKGHIPRVIEAMSEGVSFTTLEHSVDADSVDILRPNLSKLEKAIAIERAFHFSGRPYDFNFDFLTDAELVCTELISKSYEPGQPNAGLIFPLQEILGRKVTTANDIAKMFDEEYGKGNQQLNFIAFYDGHERQNKAIKSDVNTFRDSWKRSKWYIWVQDTSLESRAIK